MNHSFCSSRTLIIGLCAFVSSLGIASAQTAPAFKDVPASDPAYQAVTFLREQGIIGGYSDNTFRPKQIVDRAAALKMILAGRVTAEQVAGLQNPGFTDIPADAWYTGFVAQAVTLGIIDGPPKATAFNGSRPVILAEFLKLLLLAQQMDKNSYSEIQAPLAQDVSDTQAWFYPYVRLGVATSVIQIDEKGLLRPDRQLTRADVANYVYRLLMYKASRRTQAGLNATETELSGNVLENLTPQGVSFARMAVTRATLSVRGALTSRPDSDVVKGAVKVTEAFSAIVDAYEAGVAGKVDVTLAATSKAWDLANQAKQFNPELATITTNLQTIAHNMAEAARNAQTKK